MNATIENIINHINSVKKGAHEKKGICVLLGAGADISSGGILFRKLKILFLKENGYQISDNINDNKLDEEFENAVDNLSQYGRCETLDKIMQKNSHPSEGYQLLVMLAEMGYIDAVITTNFDYLLEATQNLLNIKPFTIFTPGRAIPQAYYQKHNRVLPIYLKMHGDLSDRLVTHLTPNELQCREYGQEFIKLFKYIIQKNSVLIIGYSGYDHLITEIFRQELDNLSDVYWCNICEPDEHSNLVSELKQNNKLRYVNVSFDKLFQELAMTFLRDAKLRNANPIFLPTVVKSKMEKQKELYENKISHLDKIINRIYETEQMEFFLQTFDQKCVAIVGKYKTGKTCFIYKVMNCIHDITFFPIMFDTSHSILENIALALGYDTTVSFSVMYSFLKWWDKKKEHLVFIIDDLFNENYYNKIPNNYYIEFFNFINIARGFKYIQFVISFQDDVYNKVKNDKIFNLFENSDFTEIIIKKFSPSEVSLLLNKYKIGSNANLIKYKVLLSNPYVWEIINTNNIDLNNGDDFFELYIDALYHRLQNLDYNVTKHALNNALMKLAYKEVFSKSEKIDTQSNVYELLKKQGIINTKYEIIYPEFLVYFSSQFLLRNCNWEEAISNNIIPFIQNSKSLSDLQIQVINYIFSKCQKIDDIKFVFGKIDVILENKITKLQNKVIMNVIYQNYQNNKDLFISYLNQIEFNIYSLQLQKYLLKLCVEFCPTLLLKWDHIDNELSYPAFIFRSDILYKYLKDPTQKNFEDLFMKSIASENGILVLLHILSYWGWDNVEKETYHQLNDIVIENLSSKVQINDNSIRTSVEMLKKYSYNIFFNAGEDFEEQFISCRNNEILKLINKVLNNKKISKNDFQYLIQLNTDINNSWIFILSNIIIIQSMKNYPNETYFLICDFFDDKNNIQVQHLDFSFSSLFWALYINCPYNRDKFNYFFKKIVHKYDRILFMFPESKRKASLNKFSEEFQRTFEDGFNPLAFYFYTSLYKSTVEKSYEWDKGYNDLDVYWKLAKNLSELGNYSEIIRIVHALGQMISIYPEEGYLALENLANYNQPIIRKGIIRLYKENYMRFSEITMQEIKKNVFEFNKDEIDEIMYNMDSFLENRSLEQLHWARIFYNLEQIKNINIAQEFLQCILHANSCSGFLGEFICNILQ